MTAPGWEDDDRLLAALRDARRAADDVPAEFVQAGKDLYTWRDFDAELAALIYDSASDDELLAVTRGAELASLRAMIFAIPDRLKIELEVGPEALLGQLDPPVAGVVEAHLATGEVITAPVDDTGYFVVRPAPTQAFRLRCPAPSGTTVTTDWIAL